VRLDAFRRVRTMLTERFEQFLAEKQA